MRFVLFYFWIPHHEIYKIFGTQYESRTHTLEGLSLLPLPIGLIVHGVLRKSRTYNIWNLNPASLPIGLVALYNSSFAYMVEGYTIFSCRGIHRSQEVFIRQSFYNDACKTFKTQQFEHLQSNHNSSITFCIANLN